MILWIRVVFQGTRCVSAGFRHPDVWRRREGIVIADPCISERPTPVTIQTDDFTPAPRVVSPVAYSPKEEAIERALRPKLLDEYVGQQKVRE